MKPLLTLVAIALFSSTAQAASYKLDANGANPLYQTTLTKEVYQYTSSNHLQDLAITNADGEPVPYAIIPHERMHQQTKVTETSEPLVIFPMQKDTLSQAGITNIQLNNHDSNTSINVISNDGKTVSNTYYLFDLGKEHPAFKKLTLDWQGQEGKLLSVDVMTSNNLNSWTPIGEAALLKVTANEQTILQNSVNFDHLINARYLQIRPQETTDSFVLTSVNLEFNQVQEVTQPTLWQEVSFLKRVENKAETSIDFESSSRYPATYLSVKLPQQNTITYATVLTRNLEDEPWQFVTKASLYRLNKNGKEYVNKDIHISKTTSRYWRLTFNQSQGGIGIENPRLSLGWLPDVLIWNARGSSPFTLHVSENNNIANTVSIMDLLNPYGIKELQQLPSSSLSLPSHTQVLNTWDTPSDYKRLWLWGGLLLGVVALAIMAYSLAKNKS
jgi:hypothetical protein